MMINNNNLSFTPYSQLMAEGRPYITINLDLEDPIELGDFVGFFAAVSGQFDRYVKSHHPEAAPNARLFVKEVRRGSIIADLFPNGIGDLVGMMDQALIVLGFAALFSKRVRSYLNGNRDQGATKGDLQDVLSTVQAIGHDSNGKAVIETVVYKEGVLTKELALSFTTAEARTAVAAVESHKKDLDLLTGADHHRVLMYFKRSDVGDAEVGKRSGERVVIEEVSPKDLPLIYASNLAEQQIKDELRHSNDNIYKKGFVVDANVQRKGGKIVAYSVTNLHQIIDLPDDGDS